MLAKISWAAILFVCGWMSMYAGNYLLEDHTLVAAGAILSGMVLCLKSGWMTADVITGNW